MWSDEQDDALRELSSASFDLVAAVLGVSLAGAVGLSDGSLRGASGAFLRLPERLQRRTVGAISRAIGEVGTTAGEAGAGATGDVATSRLVALPVAPDIGGEAVAFHVPDSETAVFAILPPGARPDASLLARAAAPALAMLDRLDDLRAERLRLLQSRGLLAHVEELAKVGGWEQTLATGRLIWSDEIYEIHGIEPGGEVTLERVLQLYPSPAREKLSLEMERAAADGGGFDVTSPIRTPAGERRIVRTVGRSRSDAGGRKLYGITQDVTKQLSAERRLWWAANHDPVTSLPNRLLFEDRLAVAAQRAEREKRPFALVVIEISDFARIADRAGYTVPDKHMMEVAARLGAVTRQSDTVARISMNEFALILYDVSSRGTLDPAMERLSGEIRQMQKEDTRGSGILMSAGIAFLPEHASGAEDLMRAAEMALAQAKRKLDRPVVVFDHQIADDVARRRETILSRARDSLSRREFVPYYQPQIDMETNEVVGVEALVRWQTADMLLDAKDFAYALDDHEIGSRVGRAVLDQVITDIGKLREATDRPLRVSVNASRTEVLRNDFLETFLEKTRNGNLKPTDFIIEITEDVIIGVDDQTLHDKVSFLVSSGVEFSLDDFGTGYASLIHITSFPVKEIKIDKQFISGIETDRRKRVIVKGIIQIARSMGLNVIAEGVETSEQQEVLRDVGCRYAQGYLYSFPLPFAQFLELLERP